MKITCQSCQSKYTVSDEKVQGKTVKIKCRKCGATILVNSAGAVAAAGGGIADPVSAASGPSDGASYLVNVSEGDQRTMSLAEVVSAYQSGAINAETYVWADGMADWAPLGQVDALVASLSGGASVYAAEQAQAQYAPESAVQPAYDPQPAAQSAYAAPAAQPAYGQQPGGYGAPAAQPGYAAAAAMPEPAPSAPRAAARREAARPSQDLFGAPQEQPQRPSDDIATSAPLFSNGAGAAGGTSGRREENSVLFSLSALTAKTGGPAPVAAPSATAPKGDDSGLIDLKALASGAAAPSPAAAIVPDDGGLFQLSAPLGAPSMAAPSIAPSVAPPAKNRGPLYIAVGVAVAGLAIAGAFLAAKGGDQPQPVATETTAAPPPTTPPVTPTPTADPGPAAVDPGAGASASPTATVVATNKAPTGGAKPGGGAGTRPGGGTGTGTKPASTAAPATPAKPKGSPCGCAPGDLMCNMACSAKGKK